MPKLGPGKHYRARGRIVLCGWSRILPRILSKILLSVLLGFLSSMAISGCRWLERLPEPSPVLSPTASPSGTTSPQSSTPQSSTSPSSTGLPPLDLNQPRAASPELLQESWETYRNRFIQADGRVIDWEAEGRSTSESQAYAMLRAVLIDDPDTFARTLKWGENNLRRQRNGLPLDSLWAWKWGREPGDTAWGIVDGNFATDADIDAATALILASRRWNRPDYLALAQTKLQDLWTLGTAVPDTTVPDTAVPDAVSVSEGVAEKAAPTATSSPPQRRYLLPGPREAFVRGDRLILNPSYLAPFAFRLFATVDRDRDWLSLVESSYFVLNQSAQLSAVGLPSDWVAWDRPSQRFAPLDASGDLLTQYSFDAYRVWWRVAWDLAGVDASGADAAEAKRFLQEHLVYLVDRLRSQQFIPAQIDLRGKAIATYEATSQYGMLYSALQWTDPDLAARLFQQKLWTTYQAGLWDDASAYYSQNLAWLGLFPPLTPSSPLLQVSPP